MIYMKKIIALLILVLFSTNVYADFFEDAQKLEQKITNFAGDDTVIVIGKQASTTEKIAFNYFKDKDKRISNFKISEANELFEIRQTAFLIGGPTQNSITKELLVLEGNIVETEDLQAAVLLFVTTQAGQKFIVFSDNQGFNNVPRNFEYSPLKNLVPEEYIPLTAAAIGFSLLWLWQWLAALVKRGIRIGLSSKIMSTVQKKELQEQYKGFMLFGLRIKFREWFSILGAAIVFALAVSLSFIKEGFIIFLLANVLVNSIIYGIRHFTRLVMDRVHEIHSEYIFWIWGGLIAVVTGWMGNAFSLAGYTVAQEAKNEGKVLFTIDLLSFLAAIIFIIWNFLAPNPLIQMAMFLSLAISVIQMMPIEPFGGKKVLAWSKWRYLLLFIPMIIVYGLVSFLF